MKLFRRLRDEKIQPLPATPRVSKHHHHHHHPHETNHWERDNIGGTKSCRPRHTFITIRPRLYEAGSSSRGVGETQSPRCRHRLLTS